MSNKLGVYIGGESPERLNYDDIEDKLHLPGPLLHYHGQPHAIADKLYNLGWSEQDIQLLMENRPSGRAFSHFIRLIQNGGAERDFAVAWLKLSKTGKLTSLDDTAYQVIRSEGPDTVMFWTFAPYLFQTLTERGIVPEQALNIVFEWSKNGASAENNWKVRGREVDTEYNLRGLEFMNEKQRHGYILSGDASHPSHSFTRQEAQHIADILMAEHTHK